LDRRRSASRNDNKLSTVVIAPHARSLSSVRINKSQTLIDLFVPHMSLSATTVSWSRPSVSGVTPMSRCAHTLTEAGGDGVFVFGGWSGKSMLADMYRLDTNSMMWAEVLQTT
jgi:hypothetical protein